MVKYIYLIYYYNRNDTIDESRNITIETIAIASLFLHLLYKFSYYIHLHNNPSRHKVIFLIIWAK